MRDQWMIESFPCPCPFFLHYLIPGPCPLLFCSHLAAVWNYMELYGKYYGNTMEDWRPNY